jgi:spore maturation protein CgeB
MKILFVAELRSESRAKQRLLALRDLGYEVKEVSTRPTEDSSSSPSFLDRVFYKLGYPADLVNLNQWLCKCATDFLPDLIWIEKVLSIHPAVYEDLRRSLPDTKIIFYSEDDIFMRHNRSVFLRKALPLFDLVFTTKPRNLQELPQLGVKKVFCIYQAYDQDIHRPLNLTPAELEQWGGEVSFIGTFERSRAEQILEIAKQGITINVWGSNWQKWKVKHPNMRVYNRAVYNDDFIRVICASKINLNFLRKLNRDQHTSRSLEIPACAGFMLAERSDEHLNLFEEGKEAEFFDSMPELLRKIQYYLSHESERLEIAMAGRKRCIKDGYSHQERLKIMLEKINLL